MQEFQRKIAAVALTLSGVLTGQGCAKELVKPETTAKASNRWNFDNSLEFILAREGGLSTNQNDRGNKGGNVTMRGVTQLTYDGYRESHGLDRRSVTQITEREIRGVYKELFWDRVQCDKISSPEMKLLLFDSAVQHSPKVAIKILQRALGGIEDDGIFGLKTEAALSRIADYQKLSEKFLSERRDYYDAIVLANPSQKQFHDGWITRLDHLKKVTTASPAVSAINQNDLSLPRFDTYVYTVKKGETLWSIAKRELQNPQRWIDIALINGIEQKDPAVRAGQEILIPKLDERRRR